MSELDAYLKVTGLQVRPALIEGARAQFEEVHALSRSVSIPASPNSMKSLYEFRVPELSPDGTCSLVEKLNPVPYDLGAILGGRNTMTTASLLLLHSMVERAVSLLKVDWLGIYQARQLPSGRALVKLAYAGAPSRAEFPLTAEFAKRSNNVTVALTKKALVIADVRAHVAAGGAYYECDAKVRSEACLPLLLADGTLVGIIDAEHSTVGRFDEPALAVLIALALDMSAHLPAGAQ